MGFGCRVQGLGFRLCLRLGVMSVYRVWDSEAKV